MMKVKMILAGMTVLASLALGGAAGAGTTNQVMRPAYVQVTNRVGGRLVVTATNVWVPVSAVAPTRQAGTNAPGK